MVKKVGTLNWQDTERYTREDLLDTIQGMECDLEAAVELMAKVASGKQTADEMGRWVSLNYPYYRETLPEHLRELPQRRKN